ncbi:MAG: ABC transporter substrate-binding protein [Proteobacteria bacterium]|nr:ABC transporter substrate-binding protein [Pseudomonadota bacterium]
MTLSRRDALKTGVIATLAGRRAFAQSTKKLKVGIITDLSGPYADLSRPSLACAQQAVEDFGAAAKGWDVEILLAEHQNKADNAVNIARQWFDREGVDALLDVNTSATSLACVGIAREKNKPMMLSGPGTTELTGKQCSPNHVHWAWDTYVLANTSGSALVKQGGTSWYFIAPDYTFGQQLVRDGSAAVQKGGGKVLGTSFYPFPSTSDFSALLLQAQASGAKVLALCNGGADMIGCVKQAREFGLDRSMTIISLLSYDTDIRAIGLEASQGLMATQTYYWDLNDRTRAFNARIKPKTPTLWPNMANAGLYSSTLHYLKAVDDLGLPQAKADGAAVIARMKAMPTDDDVFGVGRVREDGRKVHPAYLMEVKKPSESSGRYDVFKLLSTVPADQAFRPLAEGGCPLVKA